MIRLVIIFVFLIGQSVSAQILTGSIISYDKTCNDVPDGGYGTHRIDSIIKNNDNLNIYITWTDNCSFDPIYKLKKIVDNIIYLDCVDTATERAFCGCDFSIRLKFADLKIENYLVQINDSLLKPNMLRFRTKGYIIEKSKKNQIKRILYFNEFYDRQNVPVIEDLYDDNGKLIVEKFFRDGIYSRQKTFK